MSFFIVQEIGEASDYEPPPQNDGNPHYFVNDTICRINKLSNNSTDQEQVASIDFGEVLYPITLEPFQANLEDALKHGFSSHFNVRWFNLNLEETIQAGDPNIILVDRGLTEGMTVNRRGGGLSHGTVVQVDKFATMKILSKSTKSNQILCNVPLSKLKNTGRLTPLYPTLGDYVTDRNKKWIGFVSEIEWTATLATVSGDSECTYNWVDSISTILKDDYEGNSSARLKHRIRYPGQSIQLTKWEAIQEVQWQPQQWSFLKGKWRAIVPNGFLATTVKSFEPTITVQWLQQLSTGFHNQYPMPHQQYKVNEDPASNEFITLNHNFNFNHVGSPKIGSLYKFNCGNSSHNGKDSEILETLQPQTVQSWLNDFYQEISASAPNITNENEISKNCNGQGAENSNQKQYIPLFRQIFGSGVGDTGQKGSKNEIKAEKDEISDSLQIWNSVRSNTSIAGELQRQGKVLTVEIISLKSYVTVHWPKFLNRLEYLPSTQFEPALLMEDSVQVYPVGSIVKFSKVCEEANQDQQQSSPCLGCQYYGVVTSADTQSGLMSVNWFKRQSQNHFVHPPTLVGTTRSAAHELERHSDPALALVKGHLVLCHSDLQPEPLVGIFEGMGVNGMLQIQIQGNESQAQQYWPENVSKFPLCVKFNVLESTWTVVNTGSIAHIAASEKGDGTNYSRRVDGPGLSYLSPSLEILVRGTDKFGQMLLSRSRSRRRSSAEFKKCPTPQEHIFSALPMVVPKEPICMETLMRELSLYNGGSWPRIWVKTFEERLDLLSIVIEGSPHTLYEDVLFFFSVKLNETFPDTPPTIAFHSFSPENVNPCLTTSGQVLFPLLNTYKKIPGFYQEDWDPKEPSLALVLSCIQKMVLSTVPYQNEPNFQLLKLLSTSYCDYLCREGNLKYVQQLIITIYTQLENPPELWKLEMMEYYRFHVPRFHNRILKYLQPNKNKKRASNNNDLDLDSTPNYIPFPKPIPTDAVQSLKKHLRHLEQIYYQIYQNM